MKALGFMIIIVFGLTACSGSKQEPIYSDMDNKAVTSVPEEAVDNYDFSGNTN